MSRARLKAVRCLVGASALSLGLAASAAFLAAPSASAVAAKPSPRPAPKPAWSLSPYSSPSSPTHRFFFAYTLHAGESIEDHVQLANLTNHPIRFQLYPSAAANAADGGAFTLAPPNAKATGVGTWIRFGYSSITVAPKRIVILAFILDVPGGISSGDYAGGIVAVDTNASHRTTGPIGVAVQDAIGLAVYVQVSGPINPGLAISNLRVVTSPSGTFSWLTGQRTGAIEFDLDDVGNSRLAATATVSVTGTFGGRVGHFAPITVNELLPGSQVLLTVPWQDIPGIGVYHVNVRVASPSGATSGKALNAAAADLDIDISWPLLVIVIAALVGLAVLIVRHRRRRAAARAASPAAA